MRPLLALLLVFPSASALAQDRVSAELIEAFLASFGASTAEVIADALPPGIDPAVLPDGAVPLGAVRILDGGERTVAFARVSASPEATAEAYEAAPPAGWRVRDVRRAGPARPATFALCHDGDRQRVGATVVPRRAGGAYVVLAEARLPCPAGEQEEVVAIAPPPPPPPPPPTAHFELPVLEAPPDAEVLGGLADRDGRRSELRFVGGATVEGVAGHLAGVFEADGWEPLSHTEAGGGAVSVWSRSGGGYEPAVATLVVRRGRDGGVRAVAVLAD